MGEAMLEKVARAVYAVIPDATGPAGRDLSILVARAAIEAMREPTEDMKADGGAELDGYDVLSPHMTGRVAGGVFRVMMDAALEGPAMTIDAILSPPATEGRNG